MNNVKEADIGMMLFGVTASVQSLKDLAGNPKNRRLLFRDRDTIREARDQLNETIALIYRASAGRYETTE